MDENPMISKVVLTFFVLSLMLGLLWLGTPDHSRLSSLTEHSQPHYPTWMLDLWGLSYYLYLKLYIHIVNFSFCFHSQRDDHYYTSNLNVVVCSGFDNFQATVSGCDREQFSIVQCCLTVRSIKPQTPDMIPHLVTLSRHWVNKS